MGVLAANVSTAAAGDSVSHAVFVTTEGPSRELVAAARLHRWAPGVKDIPTLAGLRSRCAIEPWLSSLAGPVFELSGTFVPRAWRRALKSHPYPSPKYRTRVAALADLENLTGAADRRPVLALRRVLSADGGTTSVDLDQVRRLWASAPRQGIRATRPRTTSRASGHTTRVSDQTR